MTGMVIFLQENAWMLDRTETGKNFPVYLDMPYELQRNRN
jgi:hypothetical protein